MKRELTNQELLDRYIHSVKTLLPPDKTDDIAAEIRSNLQSLTEDRAAELGRELSPGEMSSILKQHGHPMVVASRYRDPRGRGLISPELFPLYWFTLRAIFGTWVTIRVIIAVFVLQGTATAGSVLPRLGRDILLAAFFIPAGVTLMFALWEYLEFKFRYSERWKPESLPPVPQTPKPPKQPRPVVQMIGQVVWLIFWAMALFWPAMYWVWGGRGVFSASDAVYAMRLPLWLLIFFGISQSWLGYTRFAAAEWRRFLRVAISVAGIALAIFLLRAGDLLVAGPNWDPAQAKPLATLNQMVGGVLVLACIFAGLACVHELRRYIRKTGRRLNGDHQTADSAS
jgi:Ca2+/Na+ antiporter